ncbi:MAG: response regulator [Anaerolineae bacterium]
MVGEKHLGGRVTIVEPDDQIVRLLRESFEAAGFDIKAAPTGEEGLILCRRFLPQVTLIDVDLPDADGIQICQELRATTRISYIHVILLASSLDREVRIAGLENGADDFIVIPFDPEEVTLRVRNALRRAAAHNLIDPITGLPSGRLVRSRLRDLLGEEDGWALLRLTVRHLDSFKAAHGFVATQEVLRHVGHTLSEALERWGTPDDFLGRTEGGRFVIFTAVERLDPLTEGLTARLQEMIQTHHTFREREQGYVLLQGEEGEQNLPLMSLDVQRVLASDGPFYDIRSLTEALH